VLPAPDSLVAALASGPPPAPAGKACLPQTEGPDFFSFVFVRGEFLSSDPRPSRHSVDGSNIYGTSDLGAHSNRAVASMLLR
jgi:hypothetical protein